jgi:hypothetical protein
MIVPVKCPLKFNGIFNSSISSYSLMEQYRARVFEKRAMRRIFRPKRDEITGGWRKLGGPS